MSSSEKQIQNDKVVDALRRAREKIEYYQQRDNEQIAIIGMSGRFPGADSVNELWEMIKSGQTGFKDLSDDSLIDAGVSSDDFNQTNYVKKSASFISPDAFDAQFFGYSPREAEELDPQQRVFLECAWSAMEDASYSSENYDGRVGVYAGAALSNYMLKLYDAAKTDGSHNSLQFALSNLLGLIPTRTSYHLNLTGPSVGLQTSCSTSLVAVHKAIKALKCGDCDMALAGAAAISYAKPEGYLYQAEGVLSPNGNCRPFDDRGEGTIFGNGVGVVVLKRLSDAKKDNDHIYALICGSAINNDGANKVGLTAPSVHGQRAVIESALTDANIPVESIKMLEGHGTGTLLGDPIEVSALNQAFSHLADVPLANNSCLLSSVKSNVGHLDAAAGVTSLIKAALCLKHKILPATANFEKPNKNINFSDGPFYLSNESLPWESSEYPRRAGVSSFGMGGTNAHLVLEEYLLQEQDETQKTNGKDTFIFPLSAKTSTALSQQQTDLKEFLLSNRNIKLADLAYSLQQRQLMPHRAAFAANDLEGCIKALENNNEAIAKNCDNATDNQTIVTFMFTGQGAQSIGMAKNLYQSDKCFAESFDLCLSLLSADSPVKQLLLNKDYEESFLIHQTKHTQLVLFIFEYCLAKSLINIGVKPNYLLGHSIGEYVAACLAGVFNLKDAIKLVTARGQLMQRCEPGQMVSVMLSAKQAQRFINSNIEIAAINSNNSCVLSCGHAYMQELIASFEKRNVAFRILQTSHAFHSKMMEPILADFKQYFEDVELNAPSIPVASNLTGEWLTDLQAQSPDYWVQQLRSTVLFNECLISSLNKGSNILLELGPGAVLTRLSRQVIRENSKQAIAIQSVDLENKNIADPIYHIAAQLWQSGVKLDLAATNKSQAAKRVPLPTYPFERVVFHVPVKQQGSQEKTITQLNVTQNQPMVYVPSWQQVSGLQISSNKNNESKNSRLFIVLSNDEFYNKVSINLEGPSIHVKPDVNCSLENIAANNNSNSLNPYEQQHIDELFSVISSIADNYSEVILIHALFGQFTNELTHSSIKQDAVSNQLPTSFFSINNISKSIVKYSTKLELVFVAKEHFNIIGNENIDHETALTIGQVKVIKQEIPEVNACVIDITDTITVIDTSPFYNFLNSPIKDSNDYAIRNGKLWKLGINDYVVDLENCEEKINELFPEKVVPLADNSAIIVAGNIENSLASIYIEKYLNETNHNIILINHDTKLADTYDEPLKTLLNHKNLRYFSGSLADNHWLEKTFENIQIEYPNIKGVLFTSSMGDSAHCLINDVSSSHYEPLLDVKFFGLTNLQKIIAAHFTPDFFIVQSSMSSLMGGSGLSIYTACSLFIDAKLSQWNHQYNDTFYGVINWDAVNFYGIKFSEHQFMRHALSTDQVWEVTKWFIDKRVEPRLAISNLAYQTRISANLADNTDNLLSNDQVNPDLKIHPRPNISEPYAAPENSIEENVCEVMAGLLGLDKVGVNDNFFELGGHSLLAVQAITQIRKEYGVDVPMKALLTEKPTAGGIAMLIANAINQNISIKEIDVIDNLLANFENT